MKTLTKQEKINIDILRSDLLQEAVEQKIINRLMKKRCLPDDVMEYIASLAHGPLIGALESHAATCKKCKAKYEAMKLTHAEKYILNLDGLSVKKEGNYTISDDTLTMILKLNKDYIELLNHTGEVVSCIPGLQFSTSSSEEQQKKTVIVKKDMPSYDLSLHVAMSGILGANQMEARFCAMKTDLQEYIENLKISLLGEGSEVERNTNKDGCADFSGMKQGKYEIWNGNTLIAHITIK